MKLLINRKQDVATELTNVKMEDEFACVMEKHIMLKRKISSEQKSQSTNTPFRC